MSGFYLWIKLICSFPSQLRSFLICVVCITSFCRIRSWMEMGRTQYGIFVHYAGQRETWKWSDEFVPPSWRVTWVARVACAHRMVLCFFFTGNGALFSPRLRTCCGEKKKRKLLTLSTSATLNHGGQWRSWASEASGDSEQHSDNIPPCLQTTCILSGWPLPRLLYQWNHVRNLSPCFNL